VVEVAIRLQFNQACLGAAKRRRKNQVYFGFDRDAAGRVLFLPSAWAGVMRYAAKLANKHHSVVQKIDWWPIVAGKPRNDWRRTIVSKQGGQARAHYAVHEAFQPGDIIELFAVLPDEINIADFEQLLSIVGKYKGFSPFNTTTDHYGTFEILSIAPVIREGNHGSD
jgi:hypothetical protein